MLHKLRLLVIDDDVDFIRDFAVLGNELFDLVFASTGEEGLLKIDQSEPDAVILDLRLGTGIDGLETLRQIRAGHFDLPVIMVTEHASVETAVHAMKLGAFHYTSKYPNMKELHAIIQRELRHIAWKSLFLEQSYKQYGQMIGNSPAMKKVYESISHVAPSQANVLLEGENGTGKELSAREIHARSGRAQYPFIAINCAAIPFNLFESELFGHEKGAFTGALTRKIGKFEYADEGTVFLDEISTLNMELQAKLLRVIEEKSFTRVGSNEQIKVNIRFVSASNKILTEEVKNGRFREDLYYRLNVITIKMPSLRERRDDIPLLADYFTNGIAMQLGRKGPAFTADAIKSLKNYDWPGNVRELRNVIERSLILFPDQPIQAKDLNLYARSLNSPFADLLNLPYEKAMQKVLAQFKKEYILALLERNKGNMTRAAEEAGIHRTSLYRMLNDIDSGN